MKPVITDLLNRYESGRLSRRELVQGLTMLVAAAQLPAAEPTTLGTAGVDHASVRVKDMEKSVQFYQSLFGLAVVGEDKEHRIKRLGPAGGKRVLVSLRQDEPYGMIDHFALKLEGFDRATVTPFLQGRGFTPQEDWEYGYYIRDPDGAVVQML